MGMLSKRKLEELLDSMDVRWQIFCEEITTGRGVKDSAVIAGFSERSANSQGSRLLSKAKVQKYLKHLRAARSLRTEITADKVLQELALIGFSDIADLVEFDGTDVRFKSFDEMGANSRVISKLTATTTGTDVKVHTIEIVKESKLKALLALAAHTEAVPNEPKQAPQEVNITINHRKKAEKIDFEVG